MITKAGCWVAATASVRGASHVRSDKPNQDAVRAIEADEPHAGLVAAVCDGHGGDRYVHSDVGAQLAAEVACRIGANVLREIGATGDLVAIEEHLAQVVAPSIVDSWRHRVSADAERRRHTVGRRHGRGAEVAEEPFISYGCTLVLALMGPKWVGLVQIGDGDVIVVHRDSVVSPVPGDDRLIGGETTSLCLPSAARDARVRALGSPLPELLILASDGYANSFSDASWRNDVAADLRRHLLDIGIFEIETQLPNWLAESARVGGDDVSVALIQRVDSQPNAPGDDRGESDQPAPAPPPSRRGRVWLLLVAVVVIASGALLWLLATDDGGSQKTGNAAVAQQQWVERLGTSSIVWNSVRTRGAL